MLSFFFYLFLYFLTAAISIGRRLRSPACSLARLSLWRWTREVGRHLVLFARGRARTRRTACAAESRLPKRFRARPGQSGLINKNNRRRSSDGRSSSAEQSRAGRRRRRKLEKEGEKAGDESLVAGGSPERKSFTLLEEADSQSSIRPQSNNIHWFMNEHFRFFSFFSSFFSLQI